MKLRRIDLIQHPSIEARVSVKSGYFLIINFAPIKFSN